MAVISVGASHPVRPARRLTLDLAELTVLADRAGVELPVDLQVEVNDAAAQLAGTTVSTLLADAADRLTRKGALTGADEAAGEVADSVLTNLHGLLAGRQRVRTSYGGRGRAVIAYHWVGAGAGGSLARWGDTVELSAFDDRRLGFELLRVLPERPEPAPPRERELAWRLDDIAAAGAVHEDLHDAPTGVAARALGVAPGQWESLRSWVGGHRGVLHCVVPDPHGGLPAELVWFDTDAGWWVLTPRSRRADRDVVARWRRTAEVLTDLAEVTTRWWT